MALLSHHPQTSRTISFSPLLPLRRRCHHCRRRLLIPARPRSYIYCSSPTAEPTLSVHTVLRNHDIPEDSCKALLSKFPDFFRRIKPLETLHPKLQFLRSSAGLSGVDVAEILLIRPRLLHWSLHPSLSSAVIFLSSVLPSKEDLIRALKSISCPRTDRMKANLQALRDRGVPENVVRIILFRYPRSLTRPTEKFAAALETVEEFGLHPTTNKAFPVAVDIVSFMSKESFSTKIEIFKEFGWSDEQISSAFRTVPRFFSLSDVTIRHNVGYLNEVVGWGPEVLSLIPSIMMRSVKKIIAPRCAVLNLLMSRGLLLRSRRRSSPELSVYYSYQRRFLMKEENFLKNYVDKYVDVVPEVVDAYDGRIKFTGWGWLKDEQAAKLQDLRDRGVTESTIFKLLTTGASTEELVATLENLKLSKGKFAGKVELLKELGWSEEQVLFLLRRKPKNLRLSNEILRAKVEYLREVLGWGPELLCTDLSIMQMSLEERIIPRCAVLNVLMMKDVLEKKIWCPSIFRESEKGFFANYVEKYAQEIPEVLEAYHRSIEFAGWGWLEQV